MKREKSLVLFYGPNGVGKSSVSRALATRLGGLHLQIDVFSRMQRGRFWHTRRNNKDKMFLILGVLDGALKNTSYRQFFVEGAVIFPFMIDMLEAWCCGNDVKFIAICLVGKMNDLKIRIKKRKSPKINWNKQLPGIYKKFNHKDAMILNTSKLSLQGMVRKISQALKGKAS
ncbi:MAG: hypothetical protein Q8P49_01555 [Candidatus Liptonbacteria bacterium]|nr:hypothetical protein [Candidatus Liptonbacteria bacterium]